MTFWTLINNTSLQGGDENKDGHEDGESNGVLYW